MYNLQQAKTEMHAEDASVATSSYNTRVTVAVYIIFTINILHFCLKELRVPYVWFWRGSPLATRCGHALHHRSPPSHNQRGQKPPDPSIFSHLLWLVVLARFENTFKGSRVVCKKGKTQLTFYGLVSTIQGFLKPLVGGASRTRPLKDFFSFR